MPDSSHRPRQDRPHVKLVDPQSDWDLYTCAPVVLSKHTILPKESDNLWTIPTGPKDLISCGSGGNLPAHNRRISTVFEKGSGQTCTEKHTWNRFSDIEGAKLLSNRFQLSTLL